VVEGKCHSNTPVGDRLKLSPKDLGAHLGMTMNVATGILDAVSAAR
jgi:hypothetical protein